MARTLCPRFPLRALSELVVVVVFSRARGGDAAHGAGGGRVGAVPVGRSEGANALNPKP